MSHEYTHSGQSGGHRGGHGGRRGRGFGGGFGGRGRSRGTGKGRKGRPAKCLYSEPANLNLIDWLNGESKYFRDGNGAQRTPVVTYDLGGNQGRWVARRSKSKGYIWFQQIDDDGQPVGDAKKRRPEAIPAEKATMEFFRALAEYQYRHQLENEAKQRLENEKQGGDRDDDSKKDEEPHQIIQRGWGESKYTVEDFKGIRIDWVRAKVDVLPERRAVATC